MTEDTTLRKKIEHILYGPIKGRDKSIDAMIDKLVVLLEQSYKAKYEHPVTRLEIIDHTKTGTGRDYTKWIPQNFSVELSYQDDGRTLKIFLSDDITD